MSRLNMKHKLISLDLTFIPKICPCLHIYITTTRFKTFLSSSRDIQIVLTLVSQGICLSFLSLFFNQESMKTSKFLKMIKKKKKLC